jgi:phenylacetate-CoA ligase
MFPLPHSIFEGVRFPAVPQTQAAVLLAIQEQLAASQYWPAVEMRARQFEQIGDLISHIDRSVPYYGVSLRKAGVRPGQPITEEAWRRVPILTRRAAQDGNDRLFATQTPPSHGSLGDNTTSGTSGMPVRLRQTRLHHLFWQSFVLREEVWHRRDLGATILGIRRDDERRDFSGAVHIRRMPDWGAPVSTVYPTGPSLVLDYRATVADQAEVVRRERPAYLTVYPSLLLELLRHCREHGVAFEGLRGVRTVLEVLAPEVRQLCREVLGVGVTDVYSCGEAGYLAIQCPEHGAYHLQQENALIEILDDAGAPCAPGAIGRVVVTTLHNFAMPLLRYELGDLAEMGEPCPCGRNLPVIARIVGRGRDMLTLPAGAKRYPFYGHSAMMTVRAIRQHQLVQKSLTEIEIRLVVTHPLSAAEEARIREAAIEGLGHPFEITLVYTDEIKRDASGKYAEFRSEIAAADAPRSTG